MNAPAAKQSMENLISEILRWGVRASLGLMLVGTLLAFFQGRYPELAPLIAHGQVFPLSMGSVCSGWLRLDGSAIVITGLCLLTITPLLRVGASIAGFMVLKDWALALLAFLVFALVIISFLVGMLSR
jgi:uncharacterized membrane protein